MSGARIMTAELGSSDLAWLDRQRKEYFPPDRNHLAAHLTMFHALPPSLEDEVIAQIKRMTKQAAPAASIAGLINLGRGTAYRVRSDGLEEMRAELAERFSGMLTSQDAQGWRPHITIQNKVDPGTAREVRQILEKDFKPSPLSIEGLAQHEYCGGPWRHIGTWKFRG